MSNLVLLDCFHQEVPSVWRDFLGDLQGEGVSHTRILGAWEAGREDHDLLSTWSAECVQTFGDEFRLYVSLRLSQPWQGWEQALATSRTQKNI